MNHLFNDTNPPPENPNVDEWIPQLRWLVSVMNDDDKSIAFIAGCLSQCIAKDGLTDRQSAGCQKVFDRVLDAYSHLQLDCQQPDSEVESE